MSTTATVEHRDEPIRLRAIGTEGKPTISCEGDVVRIDGLALVDPDLTALLAVHDSAEWPALVERVLSVGARGLATMGIGIDLTAVDERVRSTLTTLTDEAERRFAAVLEQGRSAMSTDLDPDLRTSLVSRIVDEFAGWRDGFLGSIDPAVEGSHTTRFLTRLGELLGPDGALEQRIAQALDPTGDGSALRALVDSMDARFQELRDLVVHQHGVDAGRTAEAEKGTAQGLTFEDEVENALRAWASGIGGCVVERTGTVTGSIPNCKVGDFVVHLPEGARIAIEAKNHVSIGLTGKDGILDELDRAKTNREAGAAVCISRRDAFPGEVGRFGAYGDRVLVVDEGDGTMTAVALQWARARLAADAAGRDHQIDAARLAERVATIRRLADTLRTSRSSLTTIRKGVDDLSERLGTLRTELLDQVDSLERELGVASSID